MLWLKQSRLPTAGRFFLPVRQAGVAIFYPNSPLMRELIKEFTLQPGL